MWLALSGSESKPQPAQLMSARQLVGPPSLARTPKASPVTGSLQVEPSGSTSTVEYRPTCCTVEGP